MKALTLTQPWASAIFVPDLKIHETRSWATRHRGPLAIHAAKGLPRYAREFAQTEIMLGRIENPIPISMVLGIVEVLDCVPTEEAALDTTALDRLYGDFAPGRWAWRLKVLEKFAEPIPARGALGLWEWNKAEAVRKEDA